MAPISLQAFIRFPCESIIQCLKKEHVDESCFLQDRLYISNVEVLYAGAVSEINY